MKTILTLFTLLLTSQAAQAFDEPMCRSWLIGGQFKIPVADHLVEFSTTTGHGCTSENIGYYYLEWAPVYDQREYSLTLASIDFPEEKILLDHAIGAITENGMPKNVVRAFRDDVIPKLIASQNAKTAEEREQFILKAKTIWKNALLTK